ncbi:MAG TPA: MBL fold metallo-hydrolase [Oscillatoriaceae cyanobacterium]
MADPKKRVEENVEGDFFVDSTCIDCDTCRQLAPASFAEADGHSYVYAQPQDDEARRAATRALLSCPTASIGGADPLVARGVMAEFPLEIDDGVYYNGFTSASSFGASSYFVRHPDGNWLIDSPKYHPALFQRFEAWGGVRYIFLSHRDDVADAARYAAKFGAERIIHAADRDAQPDAERVLEGTDAVRIGEDFLVIPTPGHTRGHCVLLVGDRHLFTGDHLAWDREAGELEAFRDACWFSWREQTASMAKLLDYRFSWVLPGHGARIHMPEDQMHRALDQLVKRMESMR